MTDFDLISLHIEKLNSQGEGLARQDSLVYFIPDTIPGEEVLVETIQKKKNLVQAQLKKIKTPSPERIQPPCVFYDQCGGCQLQHMSYTAQLQAKQEIVRDALTRLARIENPPIEPVIPSPLELGYRSRIQVHTDNEGRLGFHQKRTNDIVEVDQCLIADDIVNESLKDLRQQWDSERKKKNFTPTKGTIEIRSDDSEAFTQVNPKLNETLIKTVLEFAEPKSRHHIFDLYCGQGNFTLPLAEQAHQVWGIESSKASIQHAKELSTNINNIEWMSCSVEQGLKQLKKNQTPCQTIILDPPRSGAKNEIELVTSFKPHRIVYISCDPATFARDAKTLIEKGYELEICQPLDMFPQTAHVEVVGRFVLKK